VKQQRLQFLNIIDLFTGGRTGLFQRLFSFLSVGGMGATVNIICFSSLYALLERRLHNPGAYFIAFLLATEISILFNFVLNDRITFRHLHSHKRSWQMRCIRFHTTSLGGTLLTFVISFLLLHWLHVPALFAQAFALIVATVFNFTFHHLFTYHHAGVKEQAYMAENSTSSEHISRTSEQLKEQVISAFSQAEPESTLTPDQHSILSETQKDATLRTLIIIPTYNERENLPLLLRDIFSFVPKTDVLVVDDNSPDGTGELADQLSLQDARIHVLHRPGKLGLGTAYIAGFKYAIAQGYGAAFEMDADFSHDPRYLPDMLRAIEHADLVIGSRYTAGGATPNWSLSRRMISGCGNIFARVMLGIPVQDCTGGFRCYRRHVLEEIELDSVQSRGYAFQVELTHRVLQGGFKIVEVPITFMDRRLGVSKMSRAIVIEAFTYVLRARFIKPKPGIPGAA
jgi:dolichol-phosphate mannosyltransferase